MMRALGKTLVTLCIILAVIVGGGWFVLTQTDLGKTATNTLMSAADVTGQIENALLANEDIIAEKLGVSVEEVDSVVRNLEISDWEVVDKPSGVTASNEVSVNYRGTPVSATFYDDPAYVTVDVAGQDMTFRIPESARRYASLLQ